MRKLVILLPLLLALCGACSNNTPNSGNTTGSDTTSGSEDTTDGTSASGGDGGSGSTGDVTTPSCGNGISEAGEECDDGNEIESDACLNNCKAAQCGDGIVQTGIETCDDGNKIENDGCNNNCQPINVSHLWSLSFGDEQDQLSTDIAVDHEDNVVIAGIFKSSIVFGDTVLKSTFPFDYDFFIAKFDPTGKILWSKSFGDVLYELEVFIAIDPNNQIYLSGNSLGPVDFLDGNSLEVGNGSYTGSFLTKLDQNGQYLWGKAFPPAANSKSKRVWDISVDSTGQPTIAGFFEGTTNFDGADLIDQGKGDQFIAKFDSLGNPLWSRAFGNSSSYKSTSIHLASHGEDTFFTSEIEGAVDFGSGVVLDTGAQDYCDVLIVKLNGKGEAQWAKNFGDDGYQRGNQVIVDKDGNIFIAGVFSENLDFGKGPMVPTGIATKSDDFIAKFDASGNILWNQSWGTNNFDESSGLSLHEGHVMLSGCADNYQKIFAAQFNTDDGTLLWNQVFGTATTSQNFFNQTCSRYHSLASDSSGAILMTGFFEDQVSFGGGDLKNKGARDGFLAKFKIP